MTLEFKPLPKAGLVFDIRGISKKLRRALKAEGVIDKRMLRWTTRRWKGIKPQFASKIIVSPQRLYVETQPRGRRPSKGRKRTGGAKWWWLEEGTRVRWALMSQDWRSGSRPGRLRPNRASGKVVIAGKRAMTARNIKARPGIKARNWRAEVVKIRNRKFQAELRREFDIIARTTIKPQGLRR